MSDTPMEKAPTLHEAMSVVLKLSIGDRKVLADWIESSFTWEAETPTSQEHWGEKLNALLDKLDTGDWEAMEMDDPITWLNQQRNTEQQHRFTDWGAEA